MSAFLILGGSSQKRKEKLQELYEKIKPEKQPENELDTQLLTSQTSVKIEDVRELEHLLSLKPFQAPPKVALIPEAEKLTFEAQGALLKILEEPPGETVFILATTYPENLLETIISRCQPIYLPPEPEFSLGGEELKQARLRLEKILKSRPGERIKLAEEISGREGTISFCQVQLVLWREILLEEPNPKNATVLREIQKTLRHLGANVNPRLCLENLLLSYPRWPTCLA